MYKEFLQLKEVNMCFLNLKKFTYCGKFAFPLHFKFCISRTSAESESGNLYTDVIDTIKPPKPAKKPTARGAISLDTSQVTAHKDSDATCFKTLEQVPKDLQGVSTDGVADCLKLIKMEKHVKMFMENDIDGALLVALDLSTLSGDLGMSSLEAKKLHMFVHQGWRPKKN